MNAQAQRWIASGLIRIGILASVVGCSTAGRQYPPGVGYGISVQVSNAFAESGRFKLVEADPKIRQRIDTLRGRVWEGEATLEREDLSALARDLGVDLISYGQVVRLMETRGGRAFVGPFNMAKGSGSAEIEVTVFDAAAGRRFSARGIGRASKGAVGVLWEVGRDHRTGNVDFDALKFDEYMLGIASRRAVDSAVAQIVPEIPPEPDTMAVIGVRSPYAATGQ